MDKIVVYGVEKEYMNWMNFEFGVGFGNMGGHSYFSS